MNVLVSNAETERTQTDRRFTFYSNFEGSDVLRS